MTDTLRDLALAATPGPWHADLTSEPFFDGDPEPTGWFRDCGLGEVDNGDYMTLRYPDAAYIAACDPQTILALLDERDALRQVAKAARIHLRWPAEESRWRALRAALARVGGGAVITPTTTYRKCPHGVWEVSLNEFCGTCERQKWDAERKRMAEAVAAERARLRADVEGLARDDCPCGCDTLVSRAAVLAAIDGEADHDPA